MYTAFLTKSTGHTNIFWTSESLNILREEVSPFFETLKQLKKANLIKGVLCIRFYQDSSEKHIEQWGSI